MTFTKTQLALSIAAATLSIAIVAPQAQAASSALQVADEAAQKADALQLQMQQMADQMQAMQAELDRVKSASAKAADANVKVQELDQWMASVKHAPEATGPKDNLVAVRGGWEQLDHARGLGQSGGNLIDNANTSGGLLSDNSNATGFYIGGIFDFNVNNDLFGLWDETSFGIELGAEYSQFGQAKNILTSTPGITPANPVNPYQSLDSRLRLSVSPKIKFLHGSRLRPWLIPVGMDINILGVPSNAVSVLNTGMQFGGGLEYDLFRGIVLGTDVRYHYSTSRLDGTPTDGVSAGGYVGFKF